MNDRFVGPMRTGPSTSRWVNNLMLWLLIFALVVVPGQAVSSGTGQTPTEAVERMLKDVLYILTELKDASRLTQRQWEIEQVVRRAFNYEEMAERSLGEIGGRSNAAERRQFVRLFVQVLRDDLSDHLREYYVGQVTYLAERDEAEGTQVMVAPAGPEIDTRIEFRVVRRAGVWLVNDVSIDGASIVAKYQAQFTRILREGSFSDLMEYLKQKAVVARVESTNS